MTTAQIQYFLVAAEQLNFTLAAEQLYITQPSLSRQIATIEAELGTKLFDRTNNVVRLTEAGKTLYSRLKEFYQEYQNIVKEVRDVSSGSRGHLNLGVLEDQYMNDRFTSALRELIQENPGCEVNIVRHDSRSIFSSLMDGTIDAGIMLVYDEFQDYGFESLALDTAPAQLAVNRSAFPLDPSGMTIREMNALLEKVPLAMVTRNQFPESLQNALTRNMPFIGLDEKCQVQFLPAISSVSLYVGAGLAVTLTNKGNLLSNDPNITMVPIRDIGEITQGVVWRKETRNPLLQKLVEILNR